ncbi:hypothetical protein QTQ03_29200 [Micromonospora sp. WMMA1363]|nr:hypothetical protein [Micromonospora sp. WMMA1363]MDM4723461.1 hypothetical protein [Micromonospora sp. WMMA1363]
MGVVDQGGQDVQGVGQVAGLNILVGVVQRPWCSGVMSEAARA